MASESIPGLAKRDDVPAVTHTADGRLRRPVQLLLQVMHDVRSSAHVAGEIFRRDVTSQYRQSLFGIFLAIVPAVVTTVWAIVCQQANLINVGNVQVPYPFFVLFGMMLWSAFTEAIYGPVEGLLAEQGLLSRANIPAEAVVVARVGQVFFNFGVKLVVIAAAAVFYRVHVSWTVLLAPLGLVLLVALGTAIGLVLAPLNLLYRDVQRGLGVVTTFWLFMTPVLYLPSGHGVASVILRVNPVSALLVSTRDLAFRGSLSMPGALAVVSALTLILLTAATLFYRVAMPIVIDRANA